MSQNIKTKKLGVTKEIYDSNFNDEVIHSDKPVLVDFYADWCGPCRQVSPIIEDIGNEFSDSLKVVKINIDKNPESTDHFGVRSIPALFLFKNGKRLSSLSGVRPKAQLVDWVENTFIA